MASRKSATKTRAPDPGAKVKPKAKTATKAARKKKAPGTAAVKAAADPASRTAQAVARRQRGLQEKARKANRSAHAARPSEDAAVQAGARRQPEPPMPAQHLDKPGLEQALALAPRFRAPDYRGSGKLEGLKAIVTGGDSGIGRAVAVLFAREGADVAVFYLDEHADARDTAEAVRAEGRACHLHSGDVKDSRFCKRAVDKAARQLGGLDILVNNAAFQQHVERLEDLGDAQLEETLGTNIAGYFHMARAALPHLGQGASIINTGSETALFGSKALLDYAATKGAIHAFTLSLASQLLPRGIRVNAVAPGPVWTPLNPADREAADVANFGEDSDMGRPAQPEEISPAYVFLASPVMSSYISGVVLPVMGGPRG
ncbi:SDR family oxidoreductase [Lysobacter spongiae]|uniref:SDR family oxidoreductase n=1 Tax=Marilutibacter spongiae TaxID=2025720 RepID=A0A7W3TK58_9GAMM|nr:SDR family oxidoreductase [Lysobacter spongiae]MBB1059847.1 SDR family oxidoreductase [Lysobacter spongiae]